MFLLTEEWTRAMVEASYSRPRHKPYYKQRRCKSRKMKWFDKYYRKANPIN